MAFRVVSAGYHSQGDDPVLRGIAEGFAERFPLLDHPANVITHLRSEITNREERFQGEDEGVSSPKIHPSNNYCD